MQSNHQSVDLKFKWSGMRSLKDNLEWQRVHPRRCGEDTLIHVVNDAIAGGEAVDDGVKIAGQYFCRFT